MLLSKKQECQATERHDTLLFALEDRRPFIPHADLQNIMNRVHAQGSVYVDRARAIGSGILDSMTGELAADFKFKIAN